VPLVLANSLLARWGHSLGPVSRPFGAEAWALEVESRPAAVAVSVSIVSAAVTGTERGRR